MAIISSYTCSLVGTLIRNRDPEAHILKFQVPDILHGDMNLEVQITTGFYGTTATLIINGKTVAQTFNEKWNSG